MAWGEMEGKAANTYVSTSANFFMKHSRYQPEAEGRAAMKAKGGNLFNMLLLFVLNRRCVQIVNCIYVIFHSWDEASASVEDNPNVITCLFCE